MQSLHNTAVCRRLQKLAPLTLDASPESRIKFLRLAFKYALVREITCYELWDAGYEGVGERQWDNCFEMGDKEVVIAGLIKVARKEGFIGSVREWCGEERFAEWCGYADRKPITQVAAPQIVPGPVDTQQASLF